MRFEVTAPCSMICAGVLTVVDKDGAWAWPREGKASVAHRGCCQEEKQQWQ